MKYLLWAGLALTALLFVSLVVPHAAALPLPSGQVPTDWQARVDAGTLLYAEEEPNATELAAPLGNGYLGTYIGSDAVYIGGVFNTLAAGLPPDLSRRSRVPAAGRVEIEGARVFAAALDVERGIYYRRSYLAPPIKDGDCQIVVEQRWYAHRVYWFLFNMEIEVDTSRCKSGTLNEIPLGLLENDGGPSEDILFAPVAVPVVNAHQPPFKVFEGVTVRPEKEGTSRVKVSYVRWIGDDRLGVPLGLGSTVYHFPTVFRTSLDVEAAARCPVQPATAAGDCGSEGITADGCVKVGCCYYPSQNHSGCHFNSDVTAQALSDFEFVWKSRDELLDTHTAAWLKLWDSRIEIEGDRELARVVNASWYAVLSSIREDWPYSVSPGGLSYGGGNATYYPKQEEQGYFGHTFWDADFFVMPALLPLFPSLAESIINYRYERIETSQEIARSYGNQGTKFAWESAFTGLEECAHPNQEDHLSADISVAVRQYYRATGDKKWLATKGLPLVLGIADYWISRVQAEAGPDGQVVYNVNDVQPPNEYATGVNNSAFTNAAASAALEWAVAVTDILNVTLPAKLRATYLDVATHLKIPFDVQQQRHLDYENAQFGESLKQADVTLMGYPLQYDMPQHVRLNDLLYEVAYTNINGPAMTHAIFAIAFLELGENYTSHATQEFRQSYGLYVNGPFKVWLECPPPGCIVSTNSSTNSSNDNLPTHPVPPCPNFITGAGGFLQTMLYGYLGLRYESDHLRLNPSLPPQTTSLALRRLQFQDAVLDATYNATSLTLSLLHVGGAGSPRPLFVVDAANRGHRLLPGDSLSLPVGLTRLYSGR